MENDNLYCYGEKDKTKAKGIRGLLIVIAAWNIVSIVVNAAARGTISQIKLSCILRHDDSIPELFFNIAGVGYFLSLILSIIVVYAFFKKLKIYKYIEIFNLVSKLVFIGLIYYSFGGITEQATQLTDYLPHGAFFSAVSIIYMFTTYRAKNTFVN